MAKYGVYELPQLLRCHIHIHIGGCVLPWRTCFHHVAICSGEASIIFEKVAVGQARAQRSAYSELRNCLPKKGVAGVGVDDEFVNFTQSIVVLCFHFMKVFAEAPVAKARGHAIGTKGVNDFRRANFVPHRIKVEP